MRAFFRAACVSLLLGILTISSVGQTRSLTIERLDSPAEAGSAEPSLYAGTGGRTYLTWIERAKLGANQYSHIEMAQRLSTASCHCYL